MPLLDHFHPPLSQRRHWESFHSAWATTLADALNKDWLPEGYFAEEMITVGGRVEIDVAGLEEPPSSVEGESRNGGGVAILKKTWRPPAPDLTMPVVFPDSFEVKVFASEGGAKLVGASDRARQPGQQGSRFGPIGVCDQVRRLFASGRRRCRRGHRDQSARELAQRNLALDRPAGIAAGRYSPLRDGVPSGHASRPLARG